MNLNPEKLLNNIINVKEKMGAPDIIWAHSEVVAPKSITVYEITTNLTAAPGKLIVFAAGISADDEMNQSLLYIPSPDKKFHFMECRTIQDMRDNGRGGRYILTNNTTGLFEIFRDERKIKEKLYVCKNCLYEWNYKGYQFLPYKQQNDIVQDFNIKDFFANCKPLLQSMPLRTNQTILNQDAYDRNWDYISRAYRACKGWCCESCGVDLSDHHEILHTHHINGVKYDISFNNLKALCVLCHSEQHNHEHITKTPGFDKVKNFILQRRQNMGI